MTDGNEWISAAEALRTLKIHYGFSARQTICKRARAGLVRARAEKIVVDDKAKTETDVPTTFWWAGGEAALEQNWQSGDFSTWINHKVHVEAFGVEFQKTDIVKTVAKYC